MSNGCGCENGIFKWFKPPYSRTFYAACCLHDDDYDIGGDKKSREIADKALFTRMVCKGNYEFASNPIKITWIVIIALCYYFAVRIFGRFYFNYK